MSLRIKRLFSLILAGIIGISAMAGCTGPGSASDAEASLVPDESSEFIVKDPFAGEEFAGYQRQQFLVEDAELYEKMVKGRYYDVWDRRSDYFTVDEVYLHEQALNKMIRFEGDETIAQLFSDIATKEDESKVLYMRILTMLICQQAAGFTQAQQTTSDYDVLKSHEDYAQDIIELGWDFFSSKVDVPEYLDFEVACMGTVYDVAKLGAKTVDDYMLYQEAAKDYENACLLLDAIINTPDNVKEQYQKMDWSLQPFYYDRLVGAAKELKIILDKSHKIVFGLDLQGIYDEAAGIAMNRHLLLRTFLMGVKDFYKNDPEELEKSFDIIYTGGKALAPVFKKASMIYHASMLGGDFLLGTTDTYTLFSEMFSIAHLCDCLSYTLDSIGLSPAGEDGTVEDVSKGVVLMQYSLLARARGEHCLKLMVQQKEPLLRVIDWVASNGTDEEVNAVFDHKFAELDDIYDDLDMVLCTGVEVYYRYLQDKLIPEYKFADTDPHSLDVGSVDRETDKSLTRQLREYSVKDTDIRGTGILSADIRDYDNDGVMDMLVLFVDTCKGADTAIEPIYRNNETVSLRMVLYTMQYSEPPETKYTDPAASNPLEYYDTHRVGMLEYFQTWAKITAEYWNTKDRYTVIEGPSISSAAEIGCLCDGEARIGVATMDGVPYIYSFETMDDYTTVGPFLWRVWHVEDGQFKMDYVGGSMSWGQKNFQPNLQAYYHAASTSELQNTNLSYCMSRQPDSPEAKGTLLGRIVVDITGYRTQDYKITDYSCLKIALDKGHLAALKERGPEPEMPPEEIIQPIDQAGADALMQEIQDNSGLETQFVDSSLSKESLQLIYKTNTGKTRIIMTLNPDGSFNRIHLQSTMDQQEKEFQWIKDAILISQTLHMPDHIVGKYSGKCSMSMNDDFEGGSVTTVSIDNCMFIIDFT